MKLHKRDITSEAPLEELAIEQDVTYEIGQALKISDGMADFATGTNVPTHICVADIVPGKDAQTGRKLSAIRLQKDFVLSAPIEGDASSLKIGSKVTIAMDAKSLTTTTTSGIAEIVGFGDEEKTQAYFKF